MFSIGIWAKKPNSDIQIFALNFLLKFYEVFIQLTITLMHKIWISDVFLGQILCGMDFVITKSFHS